MFFYQAVIMLAVIFLTMLVIYVFKIKNHLVMAALILSFAALGAGGLCLVQNVFSTHYYEQKIDVDLLRSLKFSTSQKKDLRKIFSDYKPVSDLDALSGSGITKTCSVSGSGVKSQVSVSIYVLDKSETADQLFRLSQRFYGNKNYIPADSRYSLTEKGLTHRYITSYIKSTYPDYGDILYLPSKIVYLSDVLVQDDNVIVEVQERSGKPVSNKEQVIKSIVERLGGAG